MFESKWGQDFTHPFRRALGPTQPPVQYVLGLIHGAQRPGCGVDHPPHPALKLKKSRAIPLLPLCAAIDCSRVNFAFLSIHA